MTDLEPGLIPDSISKQLGPYFKRSIELQDFKPIVSYYCKFYITEFIINNKLHLSSPEVANFTALLLDNMEQCKGKLSETDLVMMQDSAASYNHVEEFAFSIFHKAYLDIINHTTTKSTVSVLKNAIEFMTILKYWGEPLKPTVAKNIKYAKFHIARILKAYRSGQDPNDYMTPEDKDFERNIDYELSEISATGFEPTTEDKSGSHSPANVDESQQFDLPAPPAFLDQDRNDGFPEPPAFIKNDSSSALPQPPSFINDPSPSPEQSPPPPQVQKPPQVHPHAPVPSIKPKHESRKISKEDIKNILSTEEKIAKTQKYCKFAISALNYEDIDTAILELKKALELLES